MDQASYDPLAREGFAEAAFTPVPIQRQDSARWYADNERVPPAVKRHIPLGSYVRAVEEQHQEDRRRMVQGNWVKLQYILNSPVPGVERWTKGRISKRLGSGWLLVKFEGQDNSVKVRTSNCCLTVRPFMGYGAAAPPTLKESSLKDLETHTTRHAPTPLVIYARAMLPAIRACETLDSTWTAEDAVIKAWGTLEAAQREPWVQASNAIVEWIESRIGESEC